MTLKRTVKTTILPSVLLLAVALVTPAYANWFNDHGLNVSRNVGSAPNPTPQDLRKTHSPDCPWRSQSLNEQGTVGVRVSLTDRGKVSGAVVERTSGFKRLDDAAVEYIMEHWLYEPNYRAHDPAPADVRADVTFKLD
jgi:TonB family protein